MTSMSLHYCGDSVAGLGLFQQAKSTDNCCAPSGSECQMDLSTTEDGCCKDEFIDLEWDTDIAIQTSSIDDIDHVDHNLTTNPLTELTINSPQAINTPQAYIPPLPLERPYILFQQFLL